MTASTTNADLCVVWFNPAVGVAGDMMLAALLDVGADESAVRAQLEMLPVDGWSLERTSTRRCGLAETAVDVETADHDHHRPWSTIDTMLADADLDPFVRDGARRTFELLAGAEARVHGIEIDEVHFHEVGAVDAIVDIVGAWAALGSLAAGDSDLGPVCAGPIGLGSGTAQMSHGRIPVPAPATLELLRGLPSVPVDLDGETATPTGVALLATMVEHWGPPPAGTITGSGRGAGRRDPASHANVVVAVTLAVDHDPHAPVDAVLIETNLDDVTPEVLAHTIETVLSAGADDAWIAPIVMKKGRPAHLLSVLCRPGLADELRALIATGTGTLGMRQRTLDKWELDRSTGEVNVEGHVIRIKVGPHGAKAEYDDAVAAATALGRPLRDVTRDAETAWFSSSGPT